MVPFQDKICENRTRFGLLVSAAVRECNDEKAISLISDAAKFASLNGVRSMSSAELEGRLLLAAERLAYKVSSKNFPGGTLLVATELYPVGGHTKVLERIAEALTDERCVSIVITASINGYLPDTISKSVAATGGEAVFLDGKDHLGKAAQLRSIAERYDRVLLMTHPEDAVAVVAFGTSKFKKPVFYYNHANHTFWLGVSIADKVLDVNKWGVNICCRLRGVDPKNVESVGIPMLSSHVEQADGCKIRRELGISEGNTLVVSAGSPRKFRDFDRWRFGDFIADVLSRNPSATFLVVGAEANAYPEWKKISTRFGDRLKLMPQMLHNRLLEHFAAADVVVDSFPMSGWTSMMDAVRQKTATVYPAGVTGPMDYFADASAFAPDIATAASIIKRLLDNKDMRAKNIAEMTDRMKESMNPVAFRKRLSAALHSVSGHSIHDFVAAPEPEDSPLSAFIYAMTIRSKIRFALPGVVLKSVREGVSKHHELSFFGGRFVWRF